MELTMGYFEDQTIIEVLKALQESLGTGLIVRGGSDFTFTVVATEWSTNAFVSVRMEDSVGTDHVRYFQGDSEDEVVLLARNWAMEMYWAGLFQI